MNRKTIAICFLLTLAILIGIPESFAHPQNSGSCSSCHGINTGQIGLEKEMVISTGNIHANAGRPTQENAQTKDTPEQMMNPMRYSLGVIGTCLVVISQFYSLRKRVLRKLGR